MTSERAILARGIRVAGRVLRHSPPRLVRFLCISALLPAIPAVAAETGGTPPRREATISRQIRWSFTVRNTSGALTPLAELWACAPVGSAPFQHCRAVRTSHTHAKTQDRLGNQVLHFTFTNLPPYSTRIVSIEAELEMSDVPSNANANAELYLQAEPFVETDDPEFKRLAPELGGLNTTNLPKRVFSFVTKHMSRGLYAKQPRGALHALKEKSGDCTEYTCLFVALCRAHGIPARVLGGYICQGNSVLDPMQFHNWAEFYSQGAWHVADPYNGSFDTHAERYVATRIMGQSETPLGGFPRFRAIGSGMKVRMN